MCGIAGFVGWDCPPEDRWHRQLAAGARQADELLRHRGPDGSGQWNNMTSPGHGALVWLVHRRLSIIDHAGGHQPMDNEDGSVHVVFNGEIYNHLELRRELSDLGHSFTSDHCDTEVLVHGWEQWKTDLPGKLRGMFAFALWDGRREELFLARDYFGQKPLFYTVTDRRLVFGSTLPSVRCWPGVAAAASIASLNRYLQVGYLPPSETIYRDIKSVEPGTWMHMDGNGLSIGAFWRPEQSLLRLGQPLDVVTDDDIRTVRQIIFDAVESQLHADVPMVGFLSGGIDSALVCGVAKALKLDRCELQTVTVGFDEKAYDEMSLAEQTAGRLNLRHHQCYIDMKPSAMPTLEWLMKYTLGQPFADSSILPTYWVANVARSLAPCALSGDGGDEIFGGYDRYRAARILGSGLRLPDWGYRSERMRRMAVASRGQGWQKQYASLCALFQPSDLAPLGNVQAAGRYQPPSSWDIIRQCMLTDQYYYLPGDVLWKVDSASMACGLEVRSPLLDHHLADWANRFSGGVMMNWRRGKLLLRRAMGDFLPPSVQRGPKRGFGVPIGAWMRDSLRADTEAILFSSDALNKALGIAQLVEHCWKEHLAGRREHTHRIFALLMLEVWHQQNRDVALS